MKRRAASWKDRLADPRLHTSSIARFSSASGGRGRCCSRSVVDDVVPDPAAGKSVSKWFLAKYRDNRTTHNPPDPTSPGSGVRNVVEPVAALLPPPGCTPPAL